MRRVSAGGRMRRALRAVADAFDRRRLIALAHAGALLVAIGLVVNALLDRDRAAQVLALRRPHVHSATTEPRACDSNAAVNTWWVAAASSGVAQRNGPRMWSPWASSSRNAAHICWMASANPNSKIGPVMLG
jgi:hypothetical protein